MSGNPKGSPWASTPRAMRNRPGVEVMLPRERWAAAKNTAARLGHPSKSSLVEALLYWAETAETAVVQAALEGAKKSTDP